MLVLIATFAITIGLAPEGGQTLPELVRQHGPVTKHIVNEWSPAELSEMVRSSDVIARVLVLTADSRLTSDQLTIESVHSVQVLSVIQSALPDLADGSVIKIRKEGGAMMLEGHQVTATDSDFPPLVIGAEYIVFLRRDSDPSMLAFHYGAQGAFLVQEGVVRQVSKAFGRWNRERGAVGLTEFVTEVRLAAASLKQ